MSVSTRLPALLLAIALAASLASACTRAHAKTTPEMPGLDVPPPPPRIVEPTEQEPPPVVTLPNEPARHTPAVPAKPPRPVESKSEPKIEVKPPEQPPELPKEEPKPAPAPLQTTPAQAEGEVERGIRGTLTKAQSDLSRVDYRVLNKDARLQYDQAKRLAQQGEEALRARNLVFARNLADKAAAIASQLAGR